MTRSAGGSVSSKLQRKLEEVKLGEFLVEMEELARPAQGSVTQLCADETIGAGMAKLREACILSAPVVSVRSGPWQMPHAPSFISFLDVADFVFAFISGLRPALKQPHALDDPAKREEARVELVQAAEEFSARTLLSVWPANDGDVLHTGYVSGASLATLISSGFLRPMTGVKVCHRLGIFRYGCDAEQAEERDDNEGIEFLRVVSQMDVIRYFDRHRGDVPEIGTFLATSVRELLGLGHAGHTLKNVEGRREVVTCTSDTIALHAFQQMLAESVSCLGVVESKRAMHPKGSKGSLIASLALSDLVGLTPDCFDDLLLPAAAFARRMAANATDESALNIPHVSPDDPLGRAIHIMSTRGVHHVWVLEDEPSGHIADDHGPGGHPKTDIPVAVITPTDIMRMCEVQNSPSLWGGSS